MDYIFDCKTTNMTNFHTVKTIRSRGIATEDLENETNVKVLAN